MVYHKSSRYSYLVSVLGVLLADSMLKTANSQAHICVSQFEAQFFIHSPLIITSVE